MDALRLIEGCGAALLIATVASPVGVSGAVFLLPVQLDLLHVPNPSVTPTNLLYNVVAGPGALARYFSTSQLRGRLVRLLLSGTVPGVVIGAVLRVYVVPGARPFRLIAAVVLVAIGAWLIRRTVASSSSPALLADRRIRTLAFVVGVVGGVYGIGGGSIVGPILVGSGMAVGVVAPAALLSTFVTSIVGAITYALLAAIATGPIAPDWPTGIACGLGGLIGGYLGARLQPHVPERVLRLLLGVLAIAVGIVYLVEAL